MCRDEQAVEFIFDRWGHANLIICEMCSEVFIRPFYFWIRTYLFEEYAGTSSVAA
jgi:hypothetical protein